MELVSRSWGVGYMLQTYPSSVGDQSLGACWYNDSVPEGRPVWRADSYAFQKNDYRPVTVIGGGYTGLSALYHLVARKSISPLGGGRPGAILLEEKQIGSGPCDFTRGYAELCDGRWNVSKGGRLGWLAPYPFVLGLAAAAQKTGRAEILENTLVTNVEQVGRLCRVTTDRGSFWTSYVVAAGGHRMAETIPVLSGQRAQTVEIYVSALLIEAIPKHVLDNGLPHKVLEVAQRFGKLPFADGSPSNVIFGVVDYKHGRIMVGSRDTTDGSVPDLDLMSRDLFYLFPKLEGLLEKSETRREMLVAAMPVSVPINQMPIVAQNGAILSVQGLAGHGLAAGVLLGKAAAKKIFSLVRNDRDLGQTFDDFGTVRHLSLPPLSHPTFRGWAAYAGQKLHHFGAI